MAASGRPVIPAPDFTLVDQYGEEHTLSDYEGKTVFLNFWATWCGPCRTLAPILEELSEEYAGEVDIYKVDIDCEQELAAAFGVRSVPTLLFIPARGMPQMATGALPKETLREAIGELLLKLPAAES